MKIRFGAIKLQSANLQNLETITHTTTVRSSLGGQPKVKETIETKPFELALRLTPEDKADFKYPAIVGLRPQDVGKANSAVTVKLKLDPKQGLSLYSDYNTEEQYTAYETRSYPSRYIQAGDEVAPYCYASESRWEYETEQIPYKATRAVTVKEEKPITDQQTFNNVYGLLTTLADQNPKVKQALGIIENFDGNKFLAEAKKAFNLDLEQQRKTLLAQLKALKNLGKPPKKDSNP